MTVEQSGVVDAIGTENDTGDIVLTITDHLEWDGDTNEHLLMLQEKLNTYLTFVESGEILETYPNAKGRDIVISIICKYPPNEPARDFLDRATAVIGGAGMKLQYEVFSGS
jgi:hypothetical protein